MSDPEALRLLVPLVLAAAVAGMGVRIVPEPERLIVFRLGKLLRLAGPGLVWLVPFVDRAVRVNLDAAVPDWRGLAPEALLEALDRYVRRPAPPR